LRSDLCVPVSQLPSGFFDDQSIAGGAAEEQAWSALHAGTSILGIAVAK
jgi:hypothetical protein